MKQFFLSCIKSEKIILLKKGMTENSKNACWLLLSVILLTGTVTGIAGPLEELVSKMTDQTRIMQREIVRYREFAERPDRVQQQMLQRQLLLRLMNLIPEQINAEKELQRIYRLADLHNITVQSFKQIPDRTVQSKTKSNRINRQIWETEFFGTWNNLILFLNDIETQSPCTRMEALQICKSGGTGKSLTLYGTGSNTALSVKGRICVYYNSSGQQRKSSLPDRRKQASS